MQGVTGSSPVPPTIFFPLPRVANPCLILSSLAIVRAASCVAGIPPEGGICASADILGMKCQRVVQDSVQAGTELSHHPSSRVLAQLLEASVARPRQGDSPCVPLACFTLRGGVLLGALVIECACSETDPRCPENSPRSADSLSLLAAFS